MVCSTLGVYTVALMLALLVVCVYGEVVKVYHYLSIGVEGPYQVVRLLYCRSFDVVPLLLI